MTLEQVNGAIAFYLNHKEEVEQVMEERRRAEHAYIAAHPTPPVSITEWLEAMVLRREAESLLGKRRLGDIALTDRTQVNVLPIPFAA